VIIMHKNRQLGPMNYVLPDLRKNTTQKKNFLIWCFLKFFFFFFFVDFFLF